MTGTSPDRAESFLERLDRELDGGRIGASRDRAWKAGLLLVASLLVLRYGTYLFDPAETLDERIYLDAFERRMRGESPYGAPGYFYSPAFARFGAGLLEHLGSDLARYLLRLLNFLGLLVIVVRAVDWLRAAGHPVRTRHWGILGILLCVSVGVLFGTSIANLSFLACGLLLLGLAHLERRPVVAGGLLALSALTKPYAVPAVLVVFVAGLRTRRRPWLGASILAGALGLAASLPSPFLRQMFTADPDYLVRLRATSFGRVGRLLGFEPPALGLVLALCALWCGAAWILARHSVAVRALGTAGVLTMPVVWNHSTVVLLPLICGAWALAVARRSEHPLELYLVGTAGAALLLFESGGIDDRSALFQLPLLLTPLLVPVFLLVYLVTAGSATRAPAEEVAP